MLSLIPYSQALNWSVRYLLDLDPLHNVKYPLEPLSSLLIRNKNTVELKDKISYRRLTIKLYGKGVCLRDELLGKEIGTKRQFKVSAGQFIVSKIDARNGAFGIISDDLDGAITTADFVSFEINNTKIIPQYLQLVVSTQRFSTMCQSQSSGTTGRQRISIDEFLNLKIPLPSLTEQKEILHVVELEVNNLLQLIIPKIPIVQQLDFISQILSQHAIMKNLQAEVDESQLLIQKDIERTIFQ